jgi:hypothetical protein
MSTATAKHCNTFAVQRPARSWFYDGWRGRESTVVYSVISSINTLYCMCAYAYAYVPISCLSSIANDTVLYRKAKHSPRATELYKRYDR